MDMTYTEVKAVEVETDRVEAVLSELTELQLALVGGGIGDVVPH